MAVILEMKKYNHKGRMPWGIRCSKGEEFTML